MARFRYKLVAGPDDADLEQARALKRPRLVWTAKLHKRFVEAVEQLGLKNAVPKTIMQVLYPPRASSTPLVNPAKWQRACGLAVHRAVKA